MIYIDIKIYWCLWAFDYSKILDYNDLGNNNSYHSLQTFDFTVMKSNDNLPKLKENSCINVQS